MDKRTREFRFRGRTTIQSGGAHGLAVFESGEPAVVLKQAVDKLRVLVAKQSRTR